MGAETFTNLNLSPEHERLQDDLLRVGQAVDVLKTAIATEGSEDDSDAMDKFDKLLTDEFSRQIQDAFLNLPSQEQESIKNSLRASLKEVKNFTNYNHLSKLCEMFGVSINSVTDSDSETGDDTETKAEIPTLLMTEFKFEGSLNDPSCKYYLSEGENRKIKVDSLSGLISILKRDNPGKLEGYSQFSSVDMSIQNINNLISVEHPSKDAVRSLQDWIYSNLPSENQDKFKQENHFRDGRGFDGQFGQATLNGLNIVVGKMEEYVKKMETYLKSLQPEQPVVPSGGGNGNGSGGSPEGVTQRIEAPTEDNKDPLQIGEGWHSMLTDIPNFKKDGVTFYSMEDNLKREEASSKTFKEGLSEDNKAYMKIKGDTALYTVTLDEQGNVSPIMEKTAQGIVSGCFLRNSPSSNAYLLNKINALPIKEEYKEGLNIFCKPDGYYLSSHGQEALRIDPKILAGNWISTDIGRNLAFINLVHLIRARGDQYGKKDPDISFKKGSNDLWEMEIHGLKKRDPDKTHENNISKVSLKEFGFDAKAQKDLAFVDELKKFKDYNNGEKWGSERYWNGKDNTFYNQAGYNLDGSSLH